MHAVTVPPLLRDTIPFSRLDQRTSLPLPLARAARDELLEASMRVFKHCASERVRDLALDLIHTVLEADASTRNRGCSSDSPGSKSAEWDHCDVEAGFGPGPGSISQVGVGPAVGVGCHSAHPPSSPPLRRSILEPKTRPRARPAPIPLPVWGSSGSGSGSTATATATAQPSTPSPPRPKPRPKPRREMADWVYPYPPYTRRLATPPSTPSTPSPQQRTVRTSPSRGPGGSPPSPLATMSPLLPLPHTEMETEMPTATATRSLPRTPKTKPPSSWPARYVAAPAPAPAPVPASASASASVSPPRPPWPAPAAPLAPPTSPTSFRTHAYPLPPATLAPAPAPFFPAHEDQGIKENFDDADFDFSTSLRHAPASTSTSGLASGFKGMYGGMVLPHLSDEEDTPLLIHKLAQAEDRHRRRSVAQRMEPSAASWGGTYCGIPIPLVSDGEGSVALSVVERDKEKEKKRTAGSGKRRTGRPWRSEEINESFERHRTTREREAGLAAEIHMLTQAVGDLHCRFDEAVADVAERMDEREQREREREQERVQGREQGREQGPAQERDKEREREREADHKPEDKGKGRKPARACSPKLEECVDANDTTYVERYGEPQSGTDTTLDAKLDALLGKIPPSLANSSDSGRPTPEGEGDDEVMRLMEAFWAKRRRERGLGQFHS